MLHEPGAIPISATTTKQAKSNEGRKRVSGRRNRRRAKDLTDACLREIKRDFSILRNSLEVAQNHCLPRSEAQDGILIHLCDEVRSVRQELSDIRRQFGLGGGAVSKPFLVRAA